MTSRQAGCLQELWKSQYGDKFCTHSRVVDYLKTKDNQNSGNLVCRECGAAFPDPLKQLGQDFSSTEATFVVAGS